MRDNIILIIKNTKKQLDVFDFPEFKILNVHDQEFKKILQITDTPSEEFWDVIVEEQKYLDEPRFAIVQKDLTKPISIRKVYDVYNFLKVLFPSALEIEFILSYNFNLNLRFNSAFQLDNSFAAVDSYADYDERKVAAINKFINQTFDRYTEINYINISKINYINAYESSHFHFSFIAFCITLESLINGNNELLYRISRATALLCGSDVEACNIIFGNVKKIYNLRSRIVHGSDFDENLVSKYLYYLECICSKVLTELMIHNIEDHKSINEKFTILGFGYRNEISENWYEFQYNPTIEKTIYNSL